MLVDCVPVFLAYHHNVGEFDWPWFAVFLFISFFLIIKIFLSILKTQNFEFCDKKIRLYNKIQNFIQSNNLDKIAKKIINNWNNRIRSNNWEK